MALAKWAFHKLSQKTYPPIKHISGETNASVTEGQHQEDIARWDSQTEGLNPGWKPAVPVGQLALDE